MARVHGYMLDLSTNEGQIFPQSPKEFEEVYSAVRNARAGLAAPHQRRQFKNTNNPTISMELRFNKLVIADLAKQMGTYDVNALRRAMDRAKAFFESLTSPRQHRGSALVQAPPVALLVWPKVLRVRVDIDQCSIRNTMFSQRDGRLVEFVATFEMVENRDRDLWSDDIRRLGSMRA